MTVDANELALRVLAESSAVLARASVNGSTPPDVDPSEIIFETLRDFLARKLPPSESLVGVTRDGTNLLPRYGWVMPWGREGSGKTSLLVDLIFHAACGIKWLHYVVERPLRVVVVINEGVPGGLQDKLAVKLERWEHDDALVLDNVAVYASPWGEFTFRNQAMSDHARDFARDFGADYVAFDPLHTLGTVGAGAPQETEEFKHVLRDFGLWNDVGVITAHHSNKSGMVSGDWARHADTVLHVEKDGKNPTTKLTVEKARPADPDELGVPQLLAWVIDSYGYASVTPEITIVADDELLDRIKETLARASKPLTLRAIRQQTEGTGTRLDAVVRAALASGELRNQAKKACRRDADTPPYAIVLPERVDEFDDTRRHALDEHEQIGMVEPEKRVVDTDDTPDTSSLPTTGGEGVSSRRPSLEGDARRHARRGQPSDDDSINPFLGDESR